MASVIHQVHSSVPGRIRYEIPSLRQRPELIANVEGRLKSTRGVKAARGNPHSATLLILFDPAQADTWPRVLAESLGVATNAIEQAAPRTGLTRSAKKATNGNTDTPVWHTMSLEELCRRVQAQHDGLSAEEAAKRLERDGANELEAHRQRSRLEIAFAQVSSTPVILLAVSAVVSALTGSVIDSVAILAVVGVNAVLGYKMERGAERTIAALAQHAEQNACIVRDGSTRERPAREVVVGDVLLLRAGSIVSADARMLECAGLAIDESSLTGESEPIEKNEAICGDAETPLGDRTNMVYRDTLVTRGEGKAVVVAIGGQTEIGRIQSLAGGVEARQTPLQIQLDQLGNQLAIGAGAACLATMGVGLLRGQALLPLVRTAVALGVAAVPEGLPTVAIATLAQGVSDMRKRHVLVRKLAAVEALGSTQILCVDKTGTLTQNRMSVVAVQAGLRDYEMRDGSLVPREGTGDSSERPAELEAILRIGVINNEVVVAVASGDDAARTLEGSSTEKALIQLALDVGIDVEALRNEFPVQATQLRAEDRKYVVTRHDGQAGPLIAVKGSPSEVLALCSCLLQDGKSRPLTDEDRQRIEKENARMAEQPLRVLGYAQLERDVAVENLPQELVWIGLVGMHDPPRRNVGELVASLDQSGVRMIMMTGDQGATAEGVAQQIGIHGEHGVQVVDATELQSTNASEMRALAEKTDVFSRVSPAHKLDIVRALQDAGFVVAMTGDGVNDSPALKAADIGVAMGKSGSVAAREVADLVLEDDELSSLVTAIREGRTIYENIRKAVRFILATNASEILFTFASVASGLGEPLSPFQLLWINLITDIFPELALAVQPPERDVLARPPRDPKRPMLNAADLRRIGMESALLTAGAFAASAMTGGAATTRARTVGFTTLVYGQLLHAVTSRSETHGLFDREGLPSNPWLASTIVGSAAAQLAICTVPSLRGLFGLAALTSGDWMRVAAGALTPMLVNEAAKKLR